uniref:hypothetical protein n=1 Tax=Streptomyces tubercidicus TaxID=47759 RepID=UPI0037DC4E77|nr:hypothetical protein OG690_38295 [Streptomyces tubercidicus]
MIRTTYKGRDIKILKGRQPGHVRTFIGGQIISHAWQGTEVQALDWFRQVIDKIDTNGPGNNPHETSPRWYEPGTYTLNKFGHVIAKNGGACCCDLYLMTPEKNIPAETAA